MSWFATLQVSLLNRLFAPLHFSALPLRRSSSWSISLQRSSYLSCDVSIGSHAGMWHNSSVRHWHSLPCDARVHCFCTERRSSLRLASISPTPIWSLAVRQRTSRQL